MAADLGNTPAVCRSSYVHPAVLEVFEAGEFADRWASASARGPRLLSRDERRLLHFLADAG